MDAFEALVSLLLRREGYWTTTGFKVELSKEEKRSIGRHSSPRWELDVLAYKPATNEVLVVECKSYLDSTGVVFRGGGFEPRERYKLFGDGSLRSVVLARLVQQLEAKGLCRPAPTVVLALATGKTATRCDRTALDARFAGEDWRLFDDAWIHARLTSTAEDGYENDLALIVSKLLLKGAQR